MMRDGTHAPRARVTTFDRLRAVVQSGHLADMTELEVKSLVAFVVRANYETGEAWPSMETIAKDIGTANVHRARSAMKSIERRGIFDVVSAGGGFGNSTRRRLTDRPNPLPQNRDGENSDAQRTGTVSVPVRSTTETGTLSVQNRDGERTDTGTLSVPGTNKNKSKNRKGNKSGRAEDVSPLVLTFPLEGGAEWGLTEKSLADFVEAFPAKDVAGEFRQARLWCINNPDRRKTAKGMPRFLTNWLTPKESRSADPAPAVRGRGHGEDLAAVLAAPRVVPSAELLAELNAPPRPGEPGHPDTVDFPKPRTRIPTEAAR